MAAAAVGVVLERKESRAEGDKKGKTLLVSFPCVLFSHPTCPTSCLPLACSPFFQFLSVPSLPACPRRRCHSLKHSCCFIQYIHSLAHTYICIHPPSLPPSLPQSLYTVHVPHPIWVCPLSSLILTFPTAAAAHIQKLTTPTPPTSSNKRVSFRERGACIPPLRSEGRRMCDLAKAKEVEEEEEGGREGGGEGNASNQGE